MRIKAVMVTGQKLGILLNVIIMDGQDGRTDGLLPFWFVLLSGHVLKNVAYPRKNKI